jgi:hypothetical protein
MRQAPANFVRFISVTTRTVPAVNLRAIDFSAIDFSAINAQRDPAERAGSARQVATRIDRYRSTENCIKLWLMETQSAVNIC